MRHRAYVLGAALLLLILPGCATGGDAPSTPGATPSTPGTTPSETAVTEEPSQPAADPDDPSTWVIGQEGMGPVSLGAPFEDARAAMPEGTGNDENCEWTAWWNATDEDYDLFAARASDSDANGPVIVIDASAWADPGSVEGPRTEDGIGIGSTFDEVQAAYPDAVPVESAVAGAADVLQVGQVFFSSRPGEDVVSAVTVTSLEVPPYEVCG